MLVIISLLALVSAQPPVGLQKYYTNVSTRAACQQAAFQWMDLKYPGVFSKDRPNARADLLAHIERNVASHLVGLRAEPHTDYPKFETFCIVEDSEKWPYREIPLELVRIKVSCPPRMKYFIHTQDRSEAHCGTTKAGDGMKYAFYDEEERAEVERALQRRAAYEEYELVKAQAQDPYEVLEAMSTLEACRTNVYRYMLSEWGRLYPDSVTRHQLMTEIKNMIISWHVSVYESVEPTTSLQYRCSISPTKAWLHPADPTREDFYMVCPASHPYPRVNPGHWTGRCDKTPSNGADDGQDWIARAARMSLHSRYDHAGSP